MLLTTFLPLCVGKIYVAMAARWQWERTVAPLLHLIRGLEAYPPA
jgi:hypothetical protein